MDMEKKQVLLIGFGEKEEKLVPLLEGMGLAVKTIGSSRVNETVGELCLGDL